MEGENVIIVYKSKRLIKTICFLLLPPGTINVKKIQTSINILIWVPDTASKWLIPKFYHWSLIVSSRPFFSPRNKEVNNTVSSPK